MARYLLTYDVSTSDKHGEARLRKVARLCEGYGFRVQKSVFELILEKQEVTMLTHKLELLIEATLDSVRIYTITSDAARIIGKGEGESSSIRVLW